MIAQAGEEEWDNPTDLQAAWLRRHIMNVIENY